MNQEIVQQIKNKSFLVTGGAGFIGSNLVSFLIKNGASKVRVLDNLSTGYLKNIESYIGMPQFEFIQGDIRDLTTCKLACEGIDFVSHQAALGSVPRSLVDPITTNDVNISGFLNMLVASCDNKVKRFVYAASSSTYGDSEVLPKVEHQIGMPLSPYAVTKYVNELYAHVFHLNYGIDCIGLRYFNVFGPNQDPKGAYAAVIPLFIDSAIQNKSIYINGNGEQTRDFTFIENVIQANVRSLVTVNKEALNTVYNIACSERISINNLVNLISRLTGTSITPIHRESRKGDVVNSLASIEKASKLLEYKPSHNIEEGLKLTIEWFKLNA